MSDVVTGRRVKEGEWAYYGLLQKATSKTCSSTGPREGLDPGSGLGPGPGPGTGPGTGTFVAPQDLNNSWRDRGGEEITFINQLATNHRRRALHR